MNTLELEDILKTHLKTAFIGVCAKDELPSDILARPAAFIVNEDIASFPGTHWCAIYFKQNGTGEYFDSFGREPNNTVKKYVELHSPSGWQYSTRQVQSNQSTLCGGFCVQFLEARHKLRHIPMSKLLQKLFPYRSPKENDQIVLQRLRQHYKANVPLFDVGFL